MAARVVVATVTRLADGRRSYLREYFVENGNRQVTFMLLDTERKSNADCCLGGFGTRGEQKRPVQVRREDFGKPG